MILSSAARPMIASLSLIQNSSFLSLRCTIELNAPPQASTSLLEQLERELIPSQFFKWRNRKVFKLRVEGLSADHHLVYTNEVVEDNYGQFLLQLPTKVAGVELRFIRLYEAAHRARTQFYLGLFIPTLLGKSSKIVISDFDKTLLDTKYSSPKEMLQSFKSPLNSYQPVNSSLNRLQQFIAEDYLPFIVSASPHFYEHPIKDWLYQQEIYTSNIYLKDYRKIFSLFNDEWTSKDIVKQTYYKIFHLLDIILQCDLPREMIMIGDDHEADPEVYLLCRALLLRKISPNQLWKMLQHKPNLVMTPKQSSILLLKLYEVESLMDRKFYVPQIKIFIRQLHAPKPLAQLISLEMLQTDVSVLEFYR